MELAELYRAAHEADPPAPAAAGAGAGLGAGAGGAGAAHAGAAGHAQAGSSQLHGHGLKAVRLGLEEAFFLHHVLGCLAVHDPAPAASAAAAATPASGQPQQAATGGRAAQQAPDSQQLRRLDGQDLWHWCVAADARFPTVYAAYQHLRGKGWVVRAGMLYGMDFVLYRLHPAVVHSDFFVLVAPQVGGQAQQPEAAAAGSRGAASSGAGAAAAPTAAAELLAANGAGPGSWPAMSWIDVQIAQRLARQVFKRLVMLHVVVGPGAALGSVSMLQHVRVCEVIVQRFVPNINYGQQQQLDALEED